MDRSSNPWRVLDDSVAGQSSDPGVGGGRAAIAGDASAGAPALRPSGRLVVGLVAAAALAAAAFAVAASGSSGGTVTVDNAGVAIDASPRGSVGPSAPLGVDLVVDIQGAVLRPGVHRLPAGSRVADAIAAAGGYGPRVDAGRAGRELNLAALLRDGDRVVVPSRDDPPGTAAGGSPDATGGGGSASGGKGSLVDLNHATASELDALPGVGPVTAQKIIAAREEQPFATIEALRDRKIVGPAAFEKLKGLVTVRP